MPVSHLHVSAVGVVVPVGAAVSHSKAFKIRFEDICIVGIGNVVLIYLVSQIRNVNASVGLAANVKLVLFELWELFVPFKDGL